MRVRNVNARTCCIAKIFWRPDVMMSQNEGWWTRRMEKVRDEISRDKINDEEDRALSHIHLWNMDYSIRYDYRLCLIPDFSSSHQRWRIADLCPEISVNHTWIEHHVGLMQSRQPLKQYGEGQMKLCLVLTSNPYDIWDLYWVLYLLRSLSRQ